MTERRLRVGRHLLLLRPLRRPDAAGLPAGSRGGGARCATLLGALRHRLRGHAGERLRRRGGERAAARGRDRRRRLRAVDGCAAELRARGARGPRRADRDLEQPDRRAAARRAQPVGRDRQLVAGRSGHAREPARAGRKAVCDGDGGAGRSPSASSDSCARFARRPWPRCSEAQRSCAWASGSRATSTSSRARTSSRELGIAEHALDVDALTARFDAVEQGRVVALLDSLSSRGWEHRAATQTRRARACAWRSRTRSTDRRGRGHRQLPLERAALEPEHRRSRRASAPRC